MAVCLCCGYVWVWCGGEGREVILGWWVTKCEVRTGAA